MVRETSSFWLILVFEMEELLQCVTVLSMQEQCETSPNNFLDLCVLQLRMSHGLLT